MFFRGSRRNNEKDIFNFRTRTWAHAFQIII